MGRPRRDDRPELATKANDALSFSESPKSSPCWTYLSGFFDGEGSITVDSPKASNVLVLSITIAQKYKAVLEELKKFLTQQGIASRIVPHRTGVNYLVVGRIRSMIRLLSQLRVIVKSRQVKAALAYLKDEISGNELLKIFEEDRAMGRRRRSPTRLLQVNFRYTHLEAVKLAQRQRTSAAIKARRIQVISRLRRQLRLLPREFDVKRVATLLEVSIESARATIYQMRAKRLITCRFKMSLSGRRKLVCSRVSGD